MYREILPHFALGTPLLVAMGSGDSNRMALLAMRNAPVAAQPANPVRAVHKLEFVLLNWLNL